MVAPSGDHLIGPGASLLNSGIVFRANRRLGHPHIFGISIAPGKYIGHSKATKAEGARPAFAAFHRGIVLHLGSSRRVEHHKGHPASVFVPNSS